MKTMSIVAAFATVCVPTFASAEISGSIELGYSVASDNVNADNVTSPSIDATLGYGNLTGIQLELDVSTMRANGLNTNRNSHSAAVDLGYAFDNGVTAGVFVEDINVARSPTTFIAYSTAGAFVGYENDTYDVEAYFGQIDGLANQDGNHFGVRGAYSLSENTKISAEFARMNVALFDQKYLGLAVSHNLTDTFGVFGAYQKYDWATFLDVEAVSLGVSYAFANGSLASLEVARVEEGPRETQVLSLGYSIPLGETDKSTARVTGFASSVADGRRGGAGKIANDYWSINR